MLPASLFLGLLMLQAYQRAKAPEGSEGLPTFPSRKVAFKEYSELAVKLATTNRKFDYLRYGRLHSEGTRQPHAWYEIKLADARTQLI